MDAKKEPPRGDQAAGDDAAKFELIDELLLRNVVGGLCFDDLSACTPDIVGPRKPGGPVHPL